MKLLVLDIDETLVHSTKVKFDIPHQFKVDDYYVCHRPFLAEFLRSASTLFKLGLWSSSSRLYVDTIKTHLEDVGVNFVFAWSVERCTQKPNLITGNYVYLKDLRKLRKLGFDINDIVVIDDTPEKLRQNSDRLIKVSEFTGSPDDNELIGVLEAAVAKANA